MIAKAPLKWVLLLAPLLASASTLELYQKLTGKTLLVAPSMPKVTDLVTSDLPADKTNAIARIEDELANSGIVVVPDGPHFIRLLPVKQRDSLLKEAPLRGSEFSPSLGDEMTPSGMVTFQGADPEQALRIYADLSQRTILRPFVLPSSIIMLTTACPLSRQEILYALDTVLAFNGIAMVNDGASFVQAVPMVQRDQVKALAPQRDPNAKLLNPKKIPTLGVQNPAEPASKLEREFERLQAALYRFINYKGPPVRPAFRLLELEADLMQKTAVASKQFDEARIWFYVQRPLSKSELLYAIETTLRLSNLAIIPVDDGSIRLGHIRELEKHSGK